MHMDMDTTQRNVEVLVLQHTLEDGPGYLGQWLDEQGVRWHAPCAEAGEPYPDSISGYRALAVLGGAWSANDERPTLRQAEALIREADALGIPVIGHCLGGQLLARALGGRVQTLPEPEIGWLPMAVEHGSAAQAWLGPPGPAVVYQWHYDGFVVLPPGARLLAGSAACAHQAFAVRQHLGMQFHIEITPAKITDWLAHPGEGYAPALARCPRSVQSALAMQAGTADHLDGSQAMARRIYARWLSAAGMERAAGSV